jgi:hypothetical protein
MGGRARADQGWGWAVLGENAAGAPGLYLPTNAAWLSDLRSELLSFPAGKHDDCVDALGLIGQLLDTISKGNRPEPPESVKRDTGYRRYESPGRLDDWISW